MNIGTLNYRNTDHNSATLVHQFGDCYLFFIFVSLVQKRVSINRVVTSTPSMAVYIEHIGCIAIIYVRTWDISTQNMRHDNNQQTNITTNKHNNPY